MKQPKSVKDIAKNPGEPLAQIVPTEQVPLPPPFDDFNEEPKYAEISDKAREKYVVLDDTIAVNIEKPKTKEEEEEFVQSFLRGLERCMNKEDNWTFLQPFEMSMEHCAHCQTCSDACHIYEESGENELYRPIYRSEILRRIYFKYIKKESTAVHGDIEINFDTVARLIELAYRCNLCRRCAQTCPIGVDNGLLSREIRKIASQEMGIAPKELHDDGAVLQLKAGSSTGMTPMVVKDNIEFIDEDTTEKTGITVETPWDKEGADILLIHNAGEIMAWPENPGAFAILFEAAGLNWTLSSEIVAYDAINYGVWYDDMMFAKVAVKHAAAAKKLGVKKIVLGECGHAHKALTVIADKVLTGDLNIPRESAMTVLRDIVRDGRVKFDKSRNDFPVTLHDPCNMVRLMGIVSPQREVIDAVVPEGRFREMAPHGVENYCCGGGSGFAIMSGHNFADWRHHDRTQEVPPDPRRLPGRGDGQGASQVRLRSVLQLQGPDPRHHGLLRCLGEGGHLLRRPRRADGERHGGREARLHRVGVALVACLSRDGTKKGDR
jgi:Fe-S oxidoreductase